MQPLEPRALRGTRVAVAMSGGVDSAVAAAILHEAGAQVVGLSLRLYDLPAGQVAERSCCAPEDLYEARQVAQTLGFSHYVLDATGRFADDVIGDFVGAYLEGRTPNPCVRCNERTKFRDLLHRARELDCAALVTGHYARVIGHSSGLALARGWDSRRDQSYFLFTLGQDELAATCFPLGEMNKDEVRDFARSRGLPVADKPDSQDICFVARGRAADFVEGWTGATPEGGDLVHLNGRVLGRHGGVHRYTVGQRHGLGVAGPEPYYVVSLDPAARKVVVGGAADVLATECVVEDLRWAAGQPPAALDALVQVRSRSAPSAARVHCEAGKALVSFHEPVRAVAPGQAAVLYDDDRVLGGGWIARTAHAA